MEKTTVIRTSPAELALDLLQTQRAFNKQCARFGVKMTAEMEMAYESGFGAALIIMGITPENALKMSQISEEIKEALEENFNE